MDGRQRLLLHVGSCYRVHGNFNHCFFYLNDEISHSNPKIFLMHIKISFDNCRQGKGFSVLETSRSAKFIREAAVLQCINNENKSRLETQVRNEA